MKVKEKDAEKNREKGVPIEQKNNGKTKKTGRMAQK